jgi:hypothetical protein
MGRIKGKVESILTNITVISHSIFSSIPRCNFHMFSKVKWHDALQKGYIVEKHLITVDFDVIKLMNYGSNVYIAADDGSRDIRCLTSIDLVVDVRAKELR